MDFIPRTPPRVHETPIMEQFQDDRVEVRLLSQDYSGDYTHLEVWIKPLNAGENILNIPLYSNGGRIACIRVRSKSEKVKFTLTYADNYEVGKDIHPRSIVYQATTDKKDALLEDFNFLFDYRYNTNYNELNKQYLSVENLGGDTDGLSIIITYYPNT